VNFDKKNTFNKPHQCRSADYWGQLQNQRQNPVRNGKFRCTVNFTNHLNKLEREMITTKSRHSSNTTTDVTLMTNASCVLN
jgi:D-alanyl-D-alanine dipeptidase